VNDEVDLREGYGEGVTVTPAGWHRGQRVVRFNTMQRGVVEGWKGDLVSVWWGSANGVVYRDWVPAVELILADDRPGWPKEVASGA